MAVTISEMPVTRAMVYDWLVEYTGPVADTPELKAFLQGKVTALSLPDEYVYLPGTQDRTKTIHIVDLTLQDVDTYGVS